MDKWLNRLIPLPHEIKISRSVMLMTGEVAVICDAAPSPALQTAVGLLRRFGQGEPGKSRFRIRLALANAAPEDVKARLQSSVNADQAYAILPDRDRGLLIAANTDGGLLYGARTLFQLVGSPAQPVDAGLEIPLAQVFDYPDLPERGQWGGSSESDLERTSQWKLNLVEAHTNVSVDKDGAAHASVSHDLIDQGQRLGVKIVPFILHLEQIIRAAGMDRHVSFAGVPDPNKPLPSDYSPGICPSSEAAERAVAAWLEQLASQAGVHEVMVWLSEGASPCFCPKCAGKEPYELEVAMLVRALRTAQKSHAELKMRVLLTQGSYPVNDKILAAVPRDVRVTYYDGGRTYDSSRNPMIYPLLEQFSRSGRWLGVYPQITSCWRTVIPWTAPQFIRFRANEFVDKKLQCMVGYAVPANACHDFNVAAMAEWTWNSKGRSPEQFCRAYAAVTGICKPDLFAKWAIPAGEAGWSLAESRLLLSLIYSPGTGLSASAPFDHRFEKASIMDTGKMDRALATAVEAERIARESGVRAMELESACTLAGLRAFQALKGAAPVLASDAPSAEQLLKAAGYLGDLDKAAADMRATLLEWGGLVGPGKQLPGRLLDTAFALPRTADLYWQAAIKHGIVDPRPGTRMRWIGGWAADDFSSKQEIVKRFDISDDVPADGGPVDVGLEFVDSAYGTGVRGVSVTIGSTSVQSIDPPKGVSRWDRMAEIRLEIPKRVPGEKVYLAITMVGLPPDAPADRKTCSGKVGLRIIATPK